MCIAVCGRTALAQDEGPILKPKAKPKPTSTLLVTCDLACNWTLDGTAEGSIDAGGSKKMSVSLSQHLVDATTTDELDKVEQQVKRFTALGQWYRTWPLMPQSISGF